MMRSIPVIRTEILKLRHSSILWVTFVAFSLAPIMGGVFMLIMRNPEAMSKASGLNAKARLMDFGADWNSYFDIMTQAIGVGGVLVFGFVMSWIFGREYSDGTAKDLLALPTSRVQMINAKFVVYSIWCLALVLINLFVGLIIGSILQIEGTFILALSESIEPYFITTILTLVLGSPIAFFAVWGRGYLAPLGFVALTLVIAQIIAATGYGLYFPWSIPGLYSGAGGEFKDDLDIFSYLILLLTGVAGYFATVYHWKYIDQKA